MTNYLRPPLGARDTPGRPVRVAVLERLLPRGRIPCLGRRRPGRLRHQPVRAGRVSRGREWESSMLVL